MRAQPTVGSATIGKVVLSCVRKQAKQVIEQTIKQHCSMASASVPASYPDFLHDGLKL